MPIILTTAILVVPNYISNFGLLPKINLPINLQFLYWISYFVLILTFSSFYSTIVLNPKDIADQLQKMAVSIPGVSFGTTNQIPSRDVITDSPRMILSTILVANPPFRFST